MPLAICFLCGQERHCAEAGSGMPRCQSCSDVKRPCARCGKTLQVAARLPDGSRICSICWHKDPSSFKECATCGAVESLYRRGLCAGCACARRVDEILARPDGAVRPGLEPLRDALTSSSDHRRVIGWLRDSPGGALIAVLGTPGAPLGHATLDRLAPDRSVEHLRSVLVTTGVLPACDERLIQLNRWIGVRVAELSDPGDQRLLRTFATWDQVGRLRHRNRGKPVTAIQADSVQALVGGAARLLAWLRARGLTLAACTQHELDIWLDEGTTYQLHARQFVRWACANKHASRLTIPPPGGENPTMPLDASARWRLVGTLLHDDSLHLADRVAGLLVLLFAQPVSSIAALQAGQITSAGGLTTLALGEEPLELPGQLAELTLELAATRQSHSVIGRDFPAPWLFPGAHPDRHTGPLNLSKRLKNIGVYSAPGRNSALLELSAEMPAVALAKLLGISISSASRWQQRHGTWAGYAAELSRR
jgi:hypothetical protein